MGNSEFRNVLHMLWFYSFGIKINLLSGLGISSFFKFFFLDFSSNFQFYSNSRENKGPLMKYIHVL